MVSVALCILAAKISDAHRIVEKAGDYVDNILVDTYPVTDFAESKNRLVEMTSNDYLLWLDTDEDIPIEFLKNLHKILVEKPAQCYRFPRKNLPDASGWPDYQTRLIRNRDCKWVRSVHEIVVDKTTLNPPADCFLLLDYPIIHYPGSLHHRLQRFKRNVHLLAEHQIDHGEWSVDEILKECDFLVSEITARYGDVESSIVLFPTVAKLEDIERA